MTGSLPPEAGSLPPEAGSLPPEAGSLPPEAVSLPPEAVSLPLDHDARDRITASGLDVTLFVEAGAGTGKTSALVQRVIGLITSGAVRLRSIAAITFTEAAAAELRDRIREQLEREAADEANHTPAQLTRLREAIDDVDLAAISTLHAFAQQMLVEHPISVGLPPRIEILDEVQSQLAFDDRWTAYVDELYDDPANEQALLRALALGLSLNSFQRSGLRTVAKVFNDNWDRLEKFKQQDIVLSDLDLGPLEDRRDALVEGLGALKPDRDDTLAVAYRARIDWCDAVLALDDPIDQIRALAEGAPKDGGKGRKDNWYDIDTARGLLAEFTETVNNSLNVIKSETLQTLAISVARFTVAAADSRRDEGRLEFHDLLVLARQLLRRDPEARNALRDRYQRILLDEFQDTDPIQIELAVLLAAPASAGYAETSWRDFDSEPGRLFFVGDPKQSIYRFRRADIELFHAAKSVFTDDGGPVALVENFRTVGPIINMINTVFAQIMDGSAPETVQPRYRPLNASRSASDLGDHRPVFFGGRADSGATASDQRRDEANDVAEGIAAIINDATNWPVQDRETGQWRPARLADIAVLIPTRAPLPYLQSAFDERGVAHRADTGSLIYETQEVRDLLATLAAIDDPNDAINLVAALRSPLFGCSDTELAQWRRSGGSFDYYATRPETLGDDHRVASALDWFEQTAQHRSWSSPSELLDRIIAERNAMALGCVDRRPRDTWNRVRFLHDQARLFTEGNGGDLRQFMRWTELQRFDGARVHEPRLEEADDDAVRILTIHGSKGLEFPIVFVAGLSTLTKPRAGVRVIFGPDDIPEIAFNQANTTSEFERHASFDDQVDKYEKQRLLYVALTRARDYLWVSLHHAAYASGTLKESYASELVSRVEAIVPGTYRTFHAEGTITTVQGADTPGFRIATPDERQQFLDQRRAALVAQRERRVWSATAIAQQLLADRDTNHADGGGHEDQLSGAKDNGEREEADQLERGIDEESVTSLDPFTHSGQPAAGYWRRGRAGSAFGRAVHSVLQWIDFADPADLNVLATAAAVAEAIPDQGPAVADAARRALTSEALTDITGATRYFKELYVAHRFGARSVEGYVDLLIERDGELAVIDYKTDSVSSESEVSAKIDRYRLQGATYALALEEATGKPVTACGFVFTSVSAATGGDAVTRWIDDLDTAKAEVRQFLGAGSR